jgi:hypothetical protein
LDSTSRGGIDEISKLATEVNPAGRWKLEEEGVGAMGRTEKDDETAPVERRDRDVVHEYMVA